MTGTTVVDFFRPCDRGLRDGTPVNDVTTLKDTGTTMNQTPETEYPLDTEGPCIDLTATISRGI